jgi:hypothetical protein
MNTIPIEFLKMVLENIQKIDSELSKSPHEEGSLIELHRELDGKYQACIKDWDKGMYNWVKNYGFSYNYFDVNAAIDNLKLMKFKLTTYSYQVNAIPNMMPSTASISVNVNNNINLQVTFETVRSQIGEMTSLTAEQTREAMDRINEIEKLLNSNESKKTKWEKAKPILVWIADKSFDIGAALLPLILKIK